MNGNERAKISFGCLVTRMNLKSTFYTWNVWQLKKIVRHAIYYHLQTTEIKRTTLLKYSWWKTNLSNVWQTAVLKNMLRDGLWFPLISEVTSYLVPRVSHLTALWGERGETLDWSGHVLLWQLRTLGRGPLWSGSLSRWALLCCDCRKPRSLTIAFGLKFWIVSIPAFV